MGFFSTIQIIKSRVVSICLLIVLVWQIFSLPVLAQGVSIPTTSVTHVSITPAFQEILLAEGQSQSVAQIVLKNTTPEVVTFDLRVIEINQFDDQGQISLVNRPLTTTQDHPIYVTLNQSPVTIAAGDQQIIEVVINNQNNLSPGGHYLAVLATQQPTTSTSPAVNLGISSFLIVRKQGGERFHLSLRANDLFQHLWHWRVPSQIELIFENQGNIHLKPQGQVLVKDLFQRVVYEGTVNEDSQYVWPGSQRTLMVNLRQIRWSWPLMWYTVEIIGQSSYGDQTFQQQGSWLVMSPSGAGLLGVGLIVGGALAWRLFKRSFDH